MYTILIVDDEANLLEVLAVALENMGYGTVTAVDDDRLEVAFDKADTKRVLDRFVRRASEV